MGNEASSSQRNSGAAAAAAAALPQSALGPTNFTYRETGFHGVPANITAITLDRAQGMLAVGTRDGVIKLFGSDGVEVVLQNRMESGKRTSELLSLTFTSNGDLLSVGRDSTIRVWDLVAQRLKGQLEASWTMCRVTAACSSLAATCRFEYVYVATDDGHIHVLNCTEPFHRCHYGIEPAELGAPEELDETGEPDEVVAMAVNPQDETQLLIGCEYTGVYLWDLAKRKCLRKFELPRMEEGTLLRSLAWHPSGREFITGHQDGALWLFRPDRSVGVKQFATNQDDQQSPRSEVRSLAWASSPGTAAAAGAGYIIASGGTLMELEPAGFTVLWAARGDEGAPALMTSQLAPYSQGCVLPTADGNFVTHFCVTFAQGATGDDCPSGLVAVTTDPSGTTSLWVHPLPDEDGSGWPPPAAMPPMPLPRPVPVPPAWRTPAVTVLAHVASCPAELLASMTRARRDLPEWGDWQWPLFGGAVHDFTGGVRPPHLTAASLVVAGYEDGTVALWASVAPVELSRASPGSLHRICEINAPNKMPTYPTEAAVTAVLFNPAAKALVVGLRGGEAAVFELEETGDFALRHFISVHSFAVTRIALAAAHGRVALADAGGVVSLSDLSTGENEIVMMNLDAEEPEPVTALETGVFGGAVEVPVLLVGTRSAAVTVFHLTSNAQIAAVTVPHQTTPGRHFLFPLVASGARQRMAEGLMPSPAAVSPPEPPTEEAEEPAGGEAEAPADGEAATAAAPGPEPEAEAEAAEPVTDLAYLLSVCGQELTLLPMQLPDAATIAAGARLAPRALAAARLAADVMDASIIPVLAPGGTMEECLMAVDMQQFVTVFAMPSLKPLCRGKLAVLADSACPSMVVCGETAEIVMLTDAFELVRASVLSAKSVLASGPANARPVVHLERLAVPRPPATSAEKTKRKSMFQRIMSRSTTDLAEVFEANQDDQNRHALMGMREDEEEDDDDEGAAGASSLQGQTGDINASMAQLGQRLDERGEKLRNIVDKTEQMKDAADEFRRTVREHNERQAKKKWWQL